MSLQSRLQQACIEAAMDKSSSVVGSVLQAKSLNSIVLTQTWLKDAVREKGSVADIITAKVFVLEFIDTDTFASVADE